MQGTTFGGWRVLAETTYGVTEFGRALRLEPGTRLRPYAAKGVDAETGCGVTLLPGTETVLVGPDGATDLVYVKAGLRLTDSPAPWDQPRRATTVTLRRSGARTASEEELVAQIELESPHMSEVEIDFVNWRKDGEVCCLISWRNPSPAARGSSMGCSRPSARSWTASTKLEAECRELREKHGAGILPAGFWARLGNVMRARDAYLEEIER